MNRLGNYYAGFDKSVFGSDDRESISFEAIDDMKVNPCNSTQQFGSRYHKNTSILRFRERLVVTLTVSWFEWRSCFVVEGL